MPYSVTTSPEARYTTHKHNARQRGIPFTLTFEQWWGLWRGRWAARGKGAGKLVMCRTRDAGAYEIGNVYIATQEHNSSTKTASKGSALPQAVLTESDIPRIRDMIALSVSKQAIGEYFGVSRRAIRNIADRKAWNGC